MIPLLVSLLPLSPSTSYRHQDHGIIYPTQLSSGILVNPPMPLPERYQFGLLAHETGSGCNHGGRRGR